MRTHGFGYLRELSSIRDYSPETDQVNARLETLEERPIKDMLKKVGILKTTKSLAKTSDLRQWFSPIEDQDVLGACTSNAAGGLIEYFEQRSGGSYVDASRLFLYKVTRRLAGLTGDSGAYLRTTMEALTAFGAPPEEYWPYVIADFDKEPDPFCYAFAQNYKALTYYRLDPNGTSGTVLLNRIKQYLVNGLPSMFGFTVYSSYEQSFTNGGLIPYPSKGDRVVGGHAVATAGHDDDKVIQHSVPGAPATKGAFLIRNSWGTGWGDGGYGWLPYEYVLRGLAVDWWSILRTSWIESRQFGD